MKISASHLSFLYKKFKIKRKVVSLIKTFPQHKKIKIEEKFKTMKTETLLALKEGKKLIYVDEAMFTTASRLTHAYSSRGVNV